MRTKHIVGDIARLGVNPVGLLKDTLNLGSLKPAANQVVNIYNNVKGAVDPQATARAISKVTNTAYNTSGLRAFNY